ncbi:uncharacterized protein LOC143052014 [Mytilus galloprovincialis]|uniref:uncharacterized protein LOC143052014 n=1 Tax=Mytilus galloprovincialis TaxID=29158 RepID=UPI003F7B9C82
MTYLVTHGSQLDATSKYGETALHHAAEFGHIDVTKCLIDQGCSPWVISLEGRTPYDLVKIESYDDEEVKRKKEEVMDFLKTVMSKTSPEVTPDTHLQEPAAPVVEDSKIPEQIKKMDHESIAIYLNALESGSERRRDINLIIVGKKSVGKTSLVRRLFGEELQSVKSTNGIEIHRRRCRINLSNWEWNKVLDTRLVKETSINNRMLQSIVKKLHQDKEKPKHDILEISSSDQISTDDNKGTITKNIEHDEEPQPKRAKMNYQFAYPEITESPLSKLAKDELLSIIGSAVDLQDEDGYANLTVWDFAGDIEYYNTHQTFLNSEAIFLVVANLHDIDDKVAYGTFNFWMDTIHCYGSINDKTEAVLLEGAHNLLDPPVIAIGTHKDKFQASRRISSDQQNYVRMSMIVLEVLSGVLYDRLYIDTKTGEILDRDKLDITEMCRKYCALKINFPSKGFRKIERVDEISTIEDTIGDDIQRIRVIRNEMQHSSVFGLDDTRYQTLITIVHDMLTRFDQRNNPAGESYVKRLDEIRTMELETRSFEEIKERMKAGFLEKMYAVFDSVVSDALNDIC